MNQENLKTPSTNRRRKEGVDLGARGEPFQWCLGGALAIGLAMIAGFLVLIFWNGLGALYPKDIQLVGLRDGTLLAGEIFRRESFRPEPHQLAEMDEAVREATVRQGGVAERILLRTGNFDVYNEDFRWVLQAQVRQQTTPKELWFIERTEWGPFIGLTKTLRLDARQYKAEELTEALIEAAHKEAEKRRGKHKTSGAGGNLQDKPQYGGRAARSAKGWTEIRGRRQREYLRAKRRHDWAMDRLQAQYNELSLEIQRLREEDGKFQLVLSTVEGQEKTLRLSEIVRMFRPNAMGVTARLGVYSSRWWELLTSEPREANTEGGGHACHLRNLRDDGDHVTGCSAFGSRGRSFP
jgi:phosphate transport system permease protein